MSCLFPRCSLQASASQAAQAAQAAHGKPFSGTFSVPENQFFELKCYSTIFKKYFSGTNTETSYSHPDVSVSSINFSMPSTTFNSKPLATNLTRHRRDGKCRTETLHGIVRAVAFPCDDAVIDGRTETPKHGNCILPWR